MLYVLEDINGYREFFLAGEGGNFPGINVDVMVAGKTVHGNQKIEQDTQKSRIR